MKLFYLFGCLGNTRVITQTALQTFQEEMGKAMKDPYKVTSVIHNVAPLFHVSYTRNVAVHIEPNVCSNKFTRTYIPAE